MSTTERPAPVRRRTEVCIVGGGPAGMMAGLLLARQGVAVTVLEKHRDFHRDFRGDTIHPSTLDLLDEMGLLEEFLALPHREMPQARFAAGGRELVMADFTRLPTRCRFMAFVPQWDFLDLLARAAEPLPGFTLLREAEAEDLLWLGDTVDGVRVRTPEGPLEVRARLVIGADGRHSRVREAAGLRARGADAPLDVLWLRLPRRDGERLPLFTSDRGALVCIDRGTSWQLGLTLARGGVEQLRAAGIGALHERIGQARPELADRVTAVGWEDVAVLEVRIDHLRRWHRRGVLCLGDAAHAMSPAGGVGINLAIQDAVAAARLLGPILAGRRPTPRELDAVRRRRQRAARMIQRLQARMIPALVPHPDRAAPTTPPVPLRVVAALPPARHLLGRLIGIGLRPEHLTARGARPGVRGRRSDALVGA